MKEWRFFKTHQAPCHPHLCHSRLDGERQFVRKPNKALIPPSGSQRGLPSPVTSIGQTWLFRTSSWLAEGCVWAFVCLCWCFVSWFQSQLCNHLQAFKGFGLNFLNLRKYSKCIYYQPILIMCICNTCVYEIIYVLQLVLKMKYWGRLMDLLERILHHLFKDIYPESFWSFLWSWCHIWFEV